MGDDTRHEDDEPTHGGELQTWRRNYDADEDLANPEPRPWFRREEESDAAFAAFRCYMRAEPPRTVVKAWREYAIAQELDHEATPARHFYDWSRTHDWRERAGAFEEYIWALECELRVVKRRRSSAVLTARSEEIMHKAIDIALSGDQRLLRDLLDRLAGADINRAKAKSDPTHQHTTFQQLNVDLSGAETPELIQLAKLLGPYIASDDG